jgi:hypothetical protein
VSAGGGAAPRLVLVVGIGRSGTSLFTGILGQLGFRVPQPEVQADDTNPRGFSEPRWVVDFHQRLMRERRVTVFDSRPAAWETMAEVAADEEVIDDLRSWLAVQLVGTDAVVVKDPRIGWFLPLWRRCADDLGAETSFATMLRRPPEVVRSARQWYGTWQHDASRAAAWLNVTLRTEAATRGSRRAFARYDRLLEGWPQEVSRVGELLEIPWLAGLDASSHPEIEAFVDPSLRRSAVGWDDVRVPDAVRRLADEVWELVSRLAEPGGDDGETRASLDAARAAYVELYEEAEAIAQSSVTAVKPRGRLARSSQARRPRPGGGGLGRRAAQLLPAGARRRLSPGWAATLPVRAVLLVPPRYRERVPLPVVRAGLRVLRALDR